MAENRVLKDNGETSEAIVTTSCFFLKNGFYAICARTEL